VRTLRSLLTLCCCAALASCTPDSDRAGDADAGTAGSVQPPPAPAPTSQLDVDAGAPEAGPPPGPAAFSLIAGGDVSLGRLIGQILLKEPERDLFKTIAPVLASADVRFVNLESQLSDQGGETENPENILIFTGPPSGADALARGRIDVVSLANNHAWDYGKKALFETMDNLDRVGVRYVGAGRTREEAYRALHIEKNGLRLALLAVTDIWNQGPLSKHPGAEHVARADHETLAESVRALRADAANDFIAVSYHGGSEYIDEPLQRTREILRGAMDAGADFVIGHHPHVTHGVEWRNGKPILYSLGNFLMRMHSNHRWTGMGYLARVKLSRGSPLAVEACPFRIHGIEALPFPGDPLRDAYERQFFSHLSLISKTVGGTSIGPTGEDGCAVLSPPDPATVLPAGTRLR
jgi:poly-gamma-glutamate synthesis protein (capsule biosynthesis protein)